MGLETMVQAKIQEKQFIRSQYRACALRAHDTRMPYAITLHDVKGVG